MSRSTGFRRLGALRLEGPLLGRRSLCRNEQTTLGQRPRIGVVKNRLIAALPPKIQERILERSETVALEFGVILCEPEQPIEHVFFPTRGFISLVAVVGKHPPLEMGLIGSEGMLGVTLALGVSAAPLRGVVQGPGEALRMSTTAFRVELARSVPLTRSSHRYLYVLMAQLTQTAACTRFHEVDKRLVRWLLMTHDRAEGDQFHLTHQFLADMLGVQRSAVTIAAGLLQKRKLIRYTRGEIHILDRRGLEASSCECYTAVRQDYASSMVRASPPLATTNSRQSADMAGASGTTSP